ncbi:hypothetical protein TPHA_0M01950 [Tetrapisispora phaffii CBS 4417]|uniref:Mediator of RNA polymerase II transcription subunit 12 n=1 Tax=Tetrapisispora phaffii (strain ATCC 24235 / CBS 4417 / NBRC 1672 / NRRL Y-8282 / UCD 70-5) TaxID=1071381 RepID=G8C0Q5_TETPH|nr:hypothetical protein TPHA_0M01950 [Tetrapisispora phaffii CBS 4417]CCE65770.1 hypothetical protein TPHA_0M01950 [Tetrapisispora phaffii CBS 4417]
MNPAKYVLIPPDELHPLVEDNDGKFKNSYPDFEPWVHTRQDDEIMLHFVAKGYYSSSKVNFESISARSSMQESLPKLADELANQFSDIIKIRELEINKISSEAETYNSDTRFSILSGPGFSLPSRMTLSDQRKDQWLNDLSSPYVSLTQMSKFLPHGLKRRGLLEQCCLRKVPIIKAIWLLKCCYSMEWTQLKLKSKDNKDHKDDKEINSQLLKEWTENFIYILEKMLLDMANYYNDPEKLKNWKSGIQYYLKLLGNCYRLELIDKQIFLYWLVEFVGKVENLEYFPLTFHILTIFWQDITTVAENDALMKPLFLVTKITDILLHKYVTISQSRSMISDEKYIINDIKKNNKIKESFLLMIRNLICDLFQNQLLEIFLFPSAKWEIYKPYLYEITNYLGNSEDIHNEAKKKLELISYRNESLKINSTLRSSNVNADELTSVENKNVDLHHVKLNCIDTVLAQALDDNSIDFDWASYVDREITQLSQVVQLVLWAISPSKRKHYEAHQIVARIILLIINSLANLREYVIEDIIWSVVFQIPKLSDEERTLFISLPDLYRLLNTLVNYGIVKVPTYIRKLISSGILYLTSSDDKFFHCTVLINLKISPLMKNQYNMVLRNVMEYDSHYFEDYNFDTINNQVEILRPELMSGESFDYDTLTYNTKTLLGEKILSSICGEELIMVNKQILLKNFDILCVKLDTFHLFYKWVEYIVYHQLIDNTETLEILCDILLRYSKLFSQYINDHILFTKTLILIYTKIVKVNDNVAYSVSSLMPFWKFFMKSFPYAIKYDENLRNELGAIYEEEKLKADKLCKDRFLLKSINEALHGNIANSTGSTFNFPEVFQTNLRTFLSENIDNATRKNSRYMMMLLMNVNRRDYNKFIAVYLKRKTFKIEDLIYLISYKLLTFEQIQNTLTMDFVLTVLSYNHSESSRYNEHIQFYAISKASYISSNFKSIIHSTMKKIDELYEFFLDILVEFGTYSKHLENTIEAIVQFLKDEKCSHYDLIIDLINYGVENKDKDDTQEIVLNESNNLYEFLDFTNLWIFQGYTKYLLQKYLLESNDFERTREFLFETVLASRYSCLCSRLFWAISDPEIMKAVITIFEERFFKNCLDDSEEYNVMWEVIIEIITSLSQQLKVNNNRTSSQSIGVANTRSPSLNNIDFISKNYNTDSWDLNSEDTAEVSSFSIYIESFDAIISHFAKMDKDKLLGMRCKLDSFLKISILNQISIFNFVTKLIKKNEVKYLNDLLENIFTLFHKISFDLSLELMLYEILSSLKSYCIFFATTENSKNKNQNSQSNTNSGSSNISISKAPDKKNNAFVIPSILMELSPFKVSSFTRKERVDEIDDNISLGINTVDTTRENTNRKKSPNNFFFYDKVQNTYLCKFYDEPYHCINNYQSEATSDSFNNSCLNLSFFDAVYERKNPK